MIKLIVGLGNPGRQYHKTRHNAGFLFLDDLAANRHCVFAKEVRFDGSLAECIVASQKLLLFKPETYMNRSGQAVGKVARYYKLEPENILVVHDELDFQVGTIRLKFGGGHAGHNGLRDIIAHLGSKQFFRLRIGIGRPQGSMQVVDYVLAEPSKSELEQIRALLQPFDRFISDMVSGDMEVVMNSFNSLSEGNKKSLT